MTITKATYSAKEVALAWQLIESAKKITLLTHYKPDEDGVSACSALAYILEKMGKTTETIYPTALEYPINRQPGNVKINSHSMVPDLIIACDTATYKRMYYPKEFTNIPLINIDHHTSNSVNGTYNLINPDASSTCEDLFYLLQQWAPQHIDTFVANCLLLGILYDSLMFRTSSTTTRTLATAIQLIDRGADMPTLKIELRAHMDPHIIPLWGKALSRVIIAPDESFIYTHITQNDIKDLGLKKFQATDGLCNFLADITRADISIIFYETETKQTKVSLRSKKRDVNELAARFGGGGHPNASGILTDKPLFEFMGEVVKTI